MKKSSESKKSSFWRHAFPLLFTVSLVTVNSFLLLTAGSGLLSRAVQRFGTGTSLGVSLLICGSLFLLVPLLFRWKTKAGSNMAWVLGLNTMTTALVLAFAPVGPVFQDRGLVLPTLVLGDEPGPVKDFLFERLSWGTGDEVPGSAPAKLPEKKWYLTQQDHERIEELKQNLQVCYDYSAGERFRKVEYAKAWVHLADTLTDPKEIAVALEFVGALHTHKTNDNKRLPYSPKCIEVVRKHLKSKDPRVVDRALRPARWIVAGPNADQKTADLMMDIAESHPSADLRREAYDSFWVSPLRSERFYKLVHKFLSEKNDSETLWVAIRVVSVQHSKTTPYPKEVRDPIVEKIWKLADHSEESVSMEAVSSMENIFKEVRGTELDQVGKRLIEKLDDPRPGVRTRAAQALSGLDYEPAIHSLIPLLSDDSENRYGKPVRHSSRQHRVDDAALTAIHDMTEDLGYLKFTYSIRKVKKYDPKLSDTVTAEAKRAREWYKKYKDSLPASPDTNS